MDVGFLGAFVGGVLSLLSPCSVLLLPAFLAYAFDDPRTLVGRTGIFLVGLMATLVPLGVLAGSVGAFLAAHRQTLMVIAALVVIALGVVQVLGITIPGLARTGDGGSDRRSIPAVFLLGAAYGVAGVCTGPILGAVLTLAAVGGSPLYGAILLGIYAAGMVAPLLVVVLLWRRGAARMRRLLAPRAVAIGPIRTTVHGLVAGALSIVLGVVLLATSAHLGTSTLLPIATQVAIEHGAAELGASVPNLAIVIVAAIGVAAWLVVRALRGRRAEQPAD